MKSAMRVLQILPALHNGGVERGTVEFAADLVRRGHESFVISDGGPMVRDLKEKGSTHIRRPIHRKSLISIGQVRPLRRLITELAPEVVHVRSRMPAWITWLALKKVPENQRPALISTFHGMYSVNPYSAIMAKADRVIAVSGCVRDYVLEHFPVDPQRLTVIQRGVDVDHFRQLSPEAGWQQRLFAEHPQLQGKTLVMLPGRITRWKGQLLFLEVLKQLVETHPQCHGVIAGGAEPGKAHFLDELKQAVRRMGLEDQVTLMGQRDDIAQLYRQMALVCHISTKAEPFGRTVTEALASGTPVVAFDRGGVAETLRACFPQGLVPADDTHAFAGKVRELLDQTKRPTIHIPQQFHLRSQTDATLAVYRQALTERGRHG